MFDSGSMSAGLAQGEEEGVDVADDVGRGDCEVFDGTVVSFVESRRDVVDIGTGDVPGVSLIAAKGRVRATY